MTIYIEQSTGQRITKAEASRRGISLSDDGGFGFVPLEEVERPEPQEGHHVVTGEDEEYEPGKWRTTWVQEPIPAPPIPQVISRAQGKSVLISMGLWAGVLAYVATIEDDLERELAEVALNDTQEWRRDSPTLNQMASELGLTEQQKDELFIAASKVVF